MRKIKPLTFNQLSHRREYLQMTIGSRLRSEFANNAYTPLPKVNLYNPEEMNSAGYTGGGLGWFNYRSSEIGVICFDDRPPSVAWQMATGITVHEHLHWLWSLSPKTLGCVSETERFVMNIFKDGANEQRAMLESVWSRRHLKRTRAILLPQAWSVGEIVEPLYKAGYLVLAVHTLLAVKGMRILRTLHNAAEPSLMAPDLWKLCEKSFGQEMPADDMNTWLKAFSLSLQAFVADSDFTRADLAREFIELFPEVAENSLPPETPLDMGGHTGEDFEREDGEPAGTTKSGKSISSKAKSPESDQTDELDSDKSNAGSSSEDESNDSTEPPPPEGKSDDSNSPENSDDSKGSGKENQDNDDQSDKSPTGTKSGDQTDQKEDSKDEAADSNGSPVQTEPEDFPELSFDDEAGNQGDADQKGEAAAEDEENKRELEELENEVREFNHSAELIPGARFSRSAGDRTFPADPRRIIEKASSQAGLLAERLRIVARPKSRVQHNRGRVVGRIIAFDPHAEKPFRSRMGLQKGFGQKVFVAMTLDTSGSMRRAGKMTAMRQAAMTIHLACVQEKVSHLVATSRVLEQVAGNGVAPDKAKALIAGVIPANSGDNYTETLPRVIEAVKKRPEQVKILMVLTDGQPHNSEIVKGQIQQARALGMIVIGVGLGLSEAEAEGMKMIFGENPDQIVLGSINGFAELAAEVLSNAVTRGSRTAR